VGNRRARRAARGIVGAKHEVIDEELRASLEEIGECGVALIGVESVRLVDADPRQLPPPLRDLVALPRECFLGVEQLEPRREPLFTCASAVLRHRCHLLCSLAFITRSARAAALVRRPEIDLAPGMRTAGVTSVARFRWTR